MYIVQGRSGRGGVLRYGVAAAGVLCSRIPDNNEYHIIRAAAPVVHSDLLFCVRRARTVNAFL